MLALMHNTFRERMRGKACHVVSVIGIVIMLIITTSEGNLTINGMKVTGFEQCAGRAVNYRFRIESACGHGIASDDPG